MINTGVGRELPKSAERFRRWIGQRPLPVVEGDHVTFVFDGQADFVSLRHWIYGLPSNLEMRRLPDSELWVRQMRFPERSRIEYKFGVVRNGHEEWILDPKNSNVAMDPFGGNSVVHCEGYQTPEWTRPIADVPRGRLQDLRIQSNVFGDARTLRVYLPAGFRHYRRYRLLVVHDGDDYLNFSSLATVLDNLIWRAEIPPLIVALSNPHHRLIEYANDPRHAEHIVKEVLPALEQAFPLILEPSGRCLMGASFGGVATLSTAWRYPKVFDSLVLQSGSFAFTDIGDHTRSPVFDPVVQFMNQFRADPGKPAQRVFISCGVYESLIYENRSLVPFLQSRGVDVKYSEARDGHNWENWRDRLREGLSWLFPGPLWVTYM
jgi:enterochelin esterase family protein